MNRRGWSAVAGVVLILAVAAAIWRARAVPPAATPPAATFPSVSLATARTATFVAHVAAPGRVGTPDGGQVRLPFAESGIVAAIDVGVGERVAAGAPLARLDAGPTGLDADHARGDARLRLAAAEARLASEEAGTSGASSDAAAATAALQQSQAKVAVDQASLAREQQLYAAGIAARKDIDAARAQLDLDRSDARAAAVRGDAAAAGVNLALVQAQADVAQAQSDLRTAMRTQTNAELRAPADGIVAAILKHPGEAVDPSQPVVVLAPPASYTVTLTIALAQAPSIRRGDPVALRVPAREIAGTGVVRDVVPSTDPLTQTATVVVDGAPPGSQPGDAVEATIALLSTPHRGIVIPTDAIVQDPESGATIVFVRTRDAGGQRFVARTIVVGASDGAVTLLQSGLRAGERIAAHGAYDLLAPSGG